MTVETLPWAIQGATHPATVERNAMAAIFGAPAATFAGGIGATAGGSHGVVGATDLVVTAGGGMNVSVSAGRAIIRASDTGGAGSLGAGSYTAWNDGAVTLAVSAADPTNPRKDLVILRTPDSNYSGASNVPLLQVVAGTPAASPADPAVPTNSLVLARIAVPALGATVLSGWLTDLRTRSWAIGAAGPVCVPQTFNDGIASGAATTMTAFGTHNSILVAPFALRMIVQVTGEAGFGGTCLVNIQIQDEAGSSITVPAVAAGSVGRSLDVTSAKWSGYSIQGVKDYAAGATCGFRVAYKVSTSNSYVGSEAVVSFYPR